jgi:hypothetical protein
MPTNSLEVVIFSFNRGRLLCNCVTSLRKFLPNVPVTVFDDTSTDKETCAILEGLSRDGWAKILTSQGLTGFPKSTPPLNGGLYENIQLFLDVHARSSWALFLQDDMQVVRIFTQYDREMLTRIFSDYPKAAFVYPAFLSYALWKYVDSATLMGNKPSFSFLYDYDFSGYFDVCIAHIDRLRDARWRFGNELASSVSAREKFGTMRLMRQPFVAYLPSPPTYRHRGQTRTQRVWERYRAGLYPIDPLSDSDLQRLISMKDTFPTAEGFLTSESFWGSHPWPDVKLEGAPSLVRALDRIESRLRRVLKRGTQSLLHIVRR